MPIQPVFPGGSTASSSSDMELIYSDTVTGSSQDEFSTGTLPTGYKSLIIDSSIRIDMATTAATSAMYFNGDQSASNYQITRFDMANDGSIGDFRSAAFSYGPNVIGASGDAGFFSNCRIIISNPEGTVNYKSWKIQAGMHYDASDVNGMRGAEVYGVWKNTDAITSIVVDVGYLSGSPKLVAGSTFAVYGLK